MIDTATRLGFVFSHTGCPCNGRPKIFKQERGGRIYQLTIWEHRKLWRLSAVGTTLIRGNDTDLETKINELWVIYRM